MSDLAQCVWGIYHISLEIQVLEFSKNRSKTNLFFCFPETSADEYTIVLYHLSTVSSEHNWIVRNKYKPHGQRSLPERLCM